MCNVVVIPNVDRDERIGSVFNHLFRVIYQTEEIGDKDVVWDFKNASFFHPFFLAPLILYKNRSQKNIITTNRSSYINRYFELIYFDDLFSIDELSDLEKTLNPYYNKSYIPFCRFDLCKSNVDGIQTIIQNIIEIQSKAGKEIKTPLSYMLGELICNISEHSDSKYGYIFSQCLSHKEKCLDICIADDGITVFGSYVKTGKFLDEIKGNEAEALKLANKGYSTKNLPDIENRGYGISTSKSMLVDGLNGGFFMLSGGAFHRHDSTGSDYISLPKMMNWGGTIVLMRIPLLVPQNFNYMSYVIR